MADVLESLGGRNQRSHSQDCSWLNRKLDEFTEIVLDISRKLEIVELATMIAAAKIDSCTGKEVADLETKIGELDNILMDLKN